MRVRVKRSRYAFYYGGLNDLERAIEACREHISPEVGFHIAVCDSVDVMHDGCSVLHFPVTSYIVFEPSGPMVFTIEEFNERYKIV